MNGWVEFGFVILFLIVVIWLILRDAPHRHAAKKGTHRVRRNSGYTDMTPGYTVISSNDSYEHNQSRHSHDHKHHDHDYSPGSHHHHSSDTGSSDSGGDSGGGDSGGGGGD